MAASPVLALGFPGRSVTAVEPHLKYVCGISIYITWVQVGADGKRGLLRNLGK